jgi:replicative DNA helicase
VKLYDPKAELFMLCAMIERRNLRPYSYSKLSPEMFGSKVGREVFERMLVLHDRGQEVKSIVVMSHDPGLTNSAQTMLKLDDRERHRVRNLVKSDVDQMLDTLRYYFKKRVVYEVVKDTTEKLSGTREVDMRGEVQGRLHTALAEMDQFDDLSQAYTHIGKGGNLSDAEIIEHLRKDKSKVLKTGFSSYDERGHLSRGNLMLLTAQKGQGKSLLAKSLGVSMFYQNYNVCTVNLEMEKWEYLYRLFAEVSPYSHDELRKGWEWTNKGKKKIDKILSQRRSLDFRGMSHDCRWSLRTVNSPTFTPQKLHQELKHQGYHVVIIDYINLFKRVQRDLWDSIYQHSKYLKMMAKDLNCLVVVLGQLTEEGRAKYARAAEEDADVWLHWELNRGQPIVKFFHGKARHYNPFSFELVFDGRKVRFVEKDELEDWEFREIQRQAEEDALEWMKRQEQLEKDRATAGLKPKGKKPKEKE